MTQDEIIEMYLQVSKELCNDTEWCWAGVGEPLQMFAKLVASKALAKQEQEPVAIVTGDAWETDIRFLPEGMALPPDTKLYTATPQRTSVGLTNEEIDSYFKDHGYSPSEGYYPVIKDVEAKLKEKNT